LKKDKTGAVRATAISYPIASDGELNLKELKPHPQPMEPIEITIGNRTYAVNGFFKPTGKTLSEKLYTIMEKEVETPDIVRYNNIIPNESLAVGNLRRA